MSMIFRSISKTISIACSPDDAFRYLADLGAWPEWAIVNVLSTAPTDDPNVWSMVTPRGEAKLRMRSDASTRVLDHDFIDPQASWTVPARVVANGDGAEFMITFFQPPHFSDDFFNEQIALVDKELAELKRLLESGAVHVTPLQSRGH